MTNLVGSPAGPPPTRPIVTFKAPRPPRTTAPKSTVAQLAAGTRYKRANREEQREKARLRMARRRAEVKGTARELANKAAAKAASARFRERNPYLLANRQRAIRDRKFAETHDWDTCAERHDRNIFFMQRRDTERAKAWASAQAEAEEEAEWEREQAECAHVANEPRSCSSIDTDEVTAHPDAEYFPTVD
ncbi:hypothetical protein FB451DRAFT_1398368 [Mycena latifolia]|nr:hypothetical protein FB451DRAFT_1398368 [Mycena latifolia]